MSARNFKARGLLLTTENLDRRAKGLVENGWPVSKWIVFAQTLLADDYFITLTEAKQTVSKYLTITKKKSGKKPVKVRFSNHAPIPAREARGDCDFFVGKVNDGPWPTTDQALEFVKRYFETKEIGA